MSKKIFVACDTTNLNKVRKIINYTQSTNLKIGYKFGLEFFYSKSGRFFLSKINKKQKIFLDLKLNDIPNTCVSAVNSLKDLKNIKYLNIILNEIKKTLKRGERVELRGFGIWSIHIQKARISRNPKTGEKIQTPEKKTIHFKMSKDLFKKLNNEE